MFKKTKRTDALLIGIVDKLKTYQNTPAQEVIKQDDFNDDETDISMYFVATGQCKVIVRDQNGQEETIKTPIKDGDHFGEIAMIY